MMSCCKVPIVFSFTAHRQIECWVCEHSVMSCHNIPIKCSTFLPTDGSGDGACEHRVMSCHNIPIKCSTSLPTDGSGVGACEHAVML